MRAPSSFFSFLTASIAVVAFAGSGPSPAIAQTANPVPYTLSFVPVPLAPGTAMHSYCVADVSPTSLLILGGRIQGLHQFNSSGNFAGPNTQLWEVNPTTGTATPIVDLTQISPELGDPLMATNQECEYHADTGDWFIVGGYGLDHKTNSYVTFPTITRLPANQILAIAHSAQLTAAKKTAAYKALFVVPDHQITDPTMRVTGGSLSHMASGLEFLAFGQDFEGNYNPFGVFTQTYTQAVLPFTITLNPFAIHPLAPKTSTLPGAPFNRRDFASGYDVDPATGQERFAIFGGVFPPGKIAAYAYPVYISGSGLSISVTPDQTLAQHFGAYEEPVIVVWDGSQVYHTFFGAISHYFLNQSPAQAQVYNYVTAQGRNDGMPFVEDISTLIENAQGQYSEYVAPDPIPNNKLHGASVDFLPNTSLSQHFQGTGSSVVNLSTFQPGEKELIGYIYGGIDADFPLPCTPSHGTHAAATMYQVYLTYTPWPNLVPASQAHEAVGPYNHGDQSSEGTSTPPTGAKKLAAPGPCAIANRKLERQTKEEK